MFVIKKTLYLIIILFLAFGYVAQSQNNSSDIKKAKAMIQEFYALYFKAASAFPINREPITTILNTYCTNELVTTIENGELSYDPFINAQDIEHDWFKSLQVSKGEGDKVFIVSYHNGESLTKIKLSLILNNSNDYKINTILDW